MRIAVVSAALAAALAGCAAAPGPDVRAACRAQGFEPGSEGFRACVDADAVPIATGPGSPYLNADDEEG